MNLPLGITLFAVSILLANPAVAITVSITAVKSVFILVSCDNCVKEPVINASKNTATIAVSPPAVCRNYTCKGYQSAQALLAIPSNSWPFFKYTDDEHLLQFLQKSQ